jgi:hypothetical protein
MAELVSARDAAGNTFQMTAQDARAAGYAVVGPEPAPQETDGHVGEKAQQAAPNKAVTSPGNTKAAGAGK